jgi:serine protease Do
MPHRIARPTRPFRLEPRPGDCPNYRASENGTVPFKRLTTQWLAAATIICLAGLQIAAGSELRLSPIVKAVEAARESVVNIRGEKTLTAASGQGSTTSQAPGPDIGRRVNGMGTGVVIDPRGYIMTNYHVVDGVRDIQVTLAGGERYVAKLVARDPETDLAIIKIETKQEIPAIALGTSTDLMIGETVIAMGNAYGYEHTVTRGIVSSLHRSVQVNDAQFYDDLIQTDASINPGNSGGPLLNIDGEMIGINVAVRAGAQGIGFAIPVDKAIAAAASMLATSNAGKLWHGVVPATDKSAGASKGVVVASVEKASPAVEAGIKPGDVITDIGGTEIQRPLDLQRSLLDRKPGDKIELALVRSGESISATLTLGAQRETQKKPGGQFWDVLGLELKPIPADEFRAAHQTNYHGGLSITAVKPNSPAANQGIHPGDVLVGMHIWETVSLENVTYIINRPDSANLNPIKFFILRGDETLYGYLPLGTVKTAQR